MTKILGIEIEPIENFVKTNFDPRFSLFKRKIPKILETYEKLFDSVLKTPLTYRQKTAVILNEKCKKTYKVCSQCERGIIVNRVKKSDSTKFKSCSTWPWTGCRGKE